MSARTVTVGSTVGLHARPASLIAQAAGELDTEVLLSVEGEDPVDASSVMMIMTLGAEHGAQVTVESEDEAAMNRIADLVAANLDA
ncbi:MAG: HPr family phosphocarrier protein [Actinomyces sp.]|jgi:phosphocarrier protein|nr:HPr family phosphocarrier protein [Actinomyces sp.]MCI1642407.1 HPr family phosphocarrier protein [Actinomyces sp.]MCI1662935.1 HPr family phosphocarrier protein [Actinomyces sp.]MCI1691529.1 HPr family phosphocarrier protein [Actinomyces sp.]MCI1787177.1 HPr family phosphocarrier protein [Actinomyces sp.]MCI1829571.1 HPr family phosphocarrier protein [Actinomyces sp.]